MKILLLISETWNDTTHPNNNMTNWFRDFPEAEIYTVSGGPGLPENSCCKNYFQVSDKMMAKSLLFGKRAGRVLRYEDYPHPESQEMGKEEVIYKNRKKLSFPLMRLIRSLIWRFGRYNERELERFIKDFNPDVVFSQRMGSVKMCRMEKIVSKYTNAPIIAYTGDDEYSLRQISFFPSHWIHRFWTRAWISKMAKKHYRLYYMMSKRQMAEYKEVFGVETDFLVKCGEFSEDAVHTSVGKPIRIVYGGKLYCNRWKTLGMIAKELRSLNANGIKATLETYTGDPINKKIKRALDDGKSTFLMGRVSAVELKKIYDESDIILHVEGFDLNNRNLTRHSFSTKVMDCLSSGAATMAVAHESHAALDYLRSNDIAICATSEEELRERLLEIVNNPGVISYYARRAIKFGKETHSREKIQKKLLDDMRRVVSENKETK